MESLKNRAAAMRHLKALGYKISRSKFFRDADNGLIVLEPDGSVRLTAIERYIKLAGLEQPAAQTAAAAIAADTKASEEIKQLRLKNQKLEHDLGVMRGKFIEKTEAESNMADLGALLDALPRHILKLNLSRYLAAIGGDATKGRTFFELFDEDFTRAINRICDDGGAWLEGGEEKWTEDNDDATT